MITNSSYTKAFFTLNQQVEQLKRRGMDCGDKTRAYEVLERYGYYRLSGYWHPYRQFPRPPLSHKDEKGREIRLDDFEQGTSLEQVVDIYNFDAELRAKLGHALSSVEVAFRFFIGHRMGRLDPFIHRNPQLLKKMVTDDQGLSKPTSGYSKWIKEYERSENSAKSSFVQHFRDKYGEHLPIWVATEVMTFGNLSNFFNLMPQSDRKIIADRLQIGQSDGSGHIIGEIDTLSNWLNSFRHARNLCFHYSRIWNRVYDVVIKAPGIATQTKDHVLSSLSDDRINNRLYGILLILRYVLLSVSPDDRQVINIARSIKTRCTALSLNLSDAGFPTDWEKNPIWDEAFQLDPSQMLAGSLVDRLETVTVKNAKALLRAENMPNGSFISTQQLSPKKVRQLLRGYSKAQEIISFKLAGTVHYPKFQFRDGTIAPEVAQLNRLLMQRCQETESTRTAAALIEWWLAPNTELPVQKNKTQMSPLNAFNLGVLASENSSLALNTFAGRYGSAAESTL
ncbi:MAG: Abi family protein [Corynebacterium sp.]|uniref:Abi family protein n=1 Tax=Corynebacterium sp. TaxID=1720 RepID=UPI0017AA4786|nr:Abi family protein [Corynebacterium sp.]NWO16584.1 Abi family protein [Corynebacterium sp.]